MLIFASFGAGDTYEPVIDETLFCQIADGSREAFCKLYELAASPVYTFALSILRSRADAEDAMQDAFLKIHAAAHLYRPEGKPMAWILTITRNICFMKIRRQRHVALYQAEDMPQQLDFKQIEDADDRLVLTAAFRILSEEERQIIFLHAVSGLKHREIAELLNLPISTVLSKCQRGLKKLKAELEESL